MRADAITQSSESSASMRTSPAFPGICRSSLMFQFVRQLSSSVRAERQTEQSSPGIVQNALFHRFEPRTMRAAECSTLRANVVSENTRGRVRVPLTKTSLLTRWWWWLTARPPLDRDAFSQSLAESAADDGLTVTCLRRCQSSQQQRVSSIQRTCIR